MMSADRVQASRAVIRLSVPIDEAIGRLRLFLWESVNALVVLKREDALTILDRYLSGTISAIDLEKWADAIEGRDDVGYDDWNGDTLRRLVVELANPLLTERVSPERACEWKEARRRTD